jgi:hypothetical protein
MTDKRTLPIIIAPIVVALGLMTVIPYGVTELGGATMVIIGGAAVLAYIVWLLTTFQRPADPAKVRTPLVLLIAMELIHMAEEQVTDFPADLRSIFDIPPSFSLVTHAVALMGAVNTLAMLAALGLGANNPVVRRIANFVVWFYVIGPGMVNAIAHVTFPILAGRVYFSGLVTVILPTVAGIWTLKRLIQGEVETRRRTAVGDLASA